MTEKEVEYEPTGRSRCMLSAVSTRDRAARMMVPSGTSRADPKGMDPIKGLYLDDRLTK